MNCKFNVELTSGAAVWLNDFVQRIDYTANAIDWKVILDAEIGREIQKSILPQRTHKTQRKKINLKSMCFLRTLW